MAKRWLITAATALELEAARKAFASPGLGLDQDRSHKTMIFGEGVVLGVCGVGTPQALLRLLDLCTAHRPDAVLQIGLAGAFDPALAIGATVAVSSESLGDLGLEIPPSAAGLPVEFRRVDAEAWAEAGVCGPWDLPPWPGAAMALVPGLRQATGLTVNTVTGTEETYRLRRRHFPAAAVETMEGAALPLACGKLNLPGYGLRAISNRVGLRRMVREEFDLALSNLSAAVKALAPLLPTWPLT